MNNATFLRFAVVGSRSSGHTCEITASVLTVGSFGILLAGNLVALGYLALNLLLGTILEPRFLGRELGMPTLLVFLSMLFWGWVLGPMGIFLSIPLTMTVLIALKSHPDTERIAVLLGPRDPA